MRKRNKIKILTCLAVVFAAMVGILIYRSENIKNTSEERVLKTEDQSVTRLAATFTYGKEDSGKKIYYHILETDYYKENPSSDITELNTSAFGVLFSVEFMDSCEAMKIQEWPAALYKKGELAYLCWTYSSEISYVLEYNTTEIQDSEIVKMAKSTE